MVTSTLSTFCHVTFCVMFWFTVPSSCILGYFTYWHTHTHTHSPFKWAASVLAVWTFCTVHVGGRMLAHTFIICYESVLYLRLFFLGSHSFSLHDHFHFPTTVMRICLYLFLINTSKYPKINLVKPLFFFVVTFIYFLHSPAVGRGGSNYVWDWMPLRGC